MTQSLCSPSLSWLSEILGGEVAFCKDKGELFSVRTGCCGESLIILISQNDGMSWTSLQGRSGSMSLSLSGSLSEL